MNATDLSTLLTQRFTRLTYAVVVYVAIFAVVVHYTYVTEAFNQREAVRLQVLGEKVEKLETRITALLAMNEGAGRELQELTFHRDHHARAMAAGLLLHPIESDPAVGTLIRSYAAAIDLLMDFFAATPAQLVDWPVSRIRDLEKAVFLMRDLQSPTTPEEIRRTQLMGDLLRQGAAQLRIRDSRPERNIASADNVFQANSAMLIQSFGRMPFLDPSPVIDSLVRDIRRLAWTANLDSLASIQKVKAAALAGTIRDPLRSEITVPFLNITMRGGSIFFLGALVCLPVLLFALTQMNQLRTLLALVGKAGAAERGALENAVRTATGSSHLLPRAPWAATGSRVILPGESRTSAFIGRLTHFSGIAGHGLFMLFFSMIPLGFIFIQFWLTETFGPSAINEPLLLVNVFLGFQVLLNWLLLYSTQTLLRYVNRLDPNS